MFVAALLSILATMVPAAAGDDEPGPIEAAPVKLDRPADFREDVLPILRAKCLACHSESVKEGGLVLESPAAIRKGGDSGPAIVAGNSNESLLALAAGRKGDVSAMPPLPNDVEAAPLTPEELGRLMLWIQEGARDSASSSQALQWRSLPPAIDAVYSLALDPGERFVAAGRANQIHLFDLIQMQELTVLGDPALGENAAGRPVAHRDIVNSLAFSPDGQWLASGGYRIVKLWHRENPLQQRQDVSAAVTTVALSDDGRWLAAGLNDGSVRIWDRSKDSEPTRLSSLDGPVSGITFVGDANLIVIAASSAELWNIATKQQTGTLITPSPAQVVQALAGGEEFATGHDDGLIRIWSIDQFSVDTATDAESVEPKQGLSGHSKSVTSLAWMAADQPLLVSGSEDGTLRLWDVGESKQTQQIEHGASVNQVVSTADGSRIASAGSDNIVRVWNVQGEKLAELTGDPRQKWELARRGDDLKVAQSRKALADKAVSDGEMDLKQREESLKEAQEQVTTAEKQVAEAAKKVTDAEQNLAEAAANLEEIPEDDGRKKAKSAADEELAKQREALQKAEDALVSAQRGEELSKVSIAAVQKELEKFKERREAEGAREEQAADAVTAAEERAGSQAAGVRGIAFDPAGNRLVVADDAGRIVQWEIASQRSLDVYESVEGTPIGAILVTPEGQIVTGTDDGHLELWVGDRLWSLAGHLGPTDPEGLDVSESALEGRVLSLDFSPDGALLATGSGAPSRSGQLLLWNLESRTITREFADAHSDTVFDVAFSRDGTLLASGAADKFAKVFDVATGKLKQNFEGHTGHVLSVTWQADGSVLATGGADNAIKAWTTATGEQQRTISSHSKPVTSIMFAGIEEKLASASGDLSVRLHTVSNGKSDRRLDGSTDFLHAVLVNQDLSRVVAGSEDGHVRVWDGTDGKLLKTFGSQ